MPRFTPLLLVCLFGARLALAGSAQIDFTPHYENSRDDGTAVRRVSFHSPAAHISMRVMGDWDILGSSDYFRVTSKTLREADARIENTPENVAANFDEEGLTKYREFAHKLMPRQAEAVEVLDEKVNALPINDWRSLEVGFSYRIAGRKFVRRILFLKLDERREVRLTVDALESDIEKFYGQFRGAFNTWLETKT